jgi:hypothetical protein
MSSGGVERCLIFWEKLMVNNMPIFVFTKRIFQLQMVTWVRKKIYEGFTTRRAYKQERAKRKT